MSYSLPALGGFDGEQGLVLGDLPDVATGFCMPHLLDKPQNPIMDALRFAHTQLPSLAPIGRPLEAAYSGSAVQIPHLMLPTVNYDIFDDTNAEARATIRSWDALRPTYDAKATPTSFLSEQASHVFSAARYHVSPRIHDENVAFEFVSKKELVDSLQSVVLGTSSSLHSWDPVSETFTLSSSKGKTHTILVMDGRDEIISNSFLQRFMNIGTTLRRLETLVDSYRAPRLRNGPTMHAFLHALSSILAHLRTELAASGLLDVSISEEPIRLSKIWLNHATFEEATSSLASLCFRSSTESPSNFGVLPKSPPKLLSHIYNHLALHIERRSPRMVTALTAYLLTASSRDYFDRLCKSVGLGSVEKVSCRADRASVDFMATEAPDVQFDTDLEDDLMDPEIPDFMSAPLADALPRAQKSLGLLYIAAPDHPLLKSGSPVSSLRWFWTDQEAQAAWRGETGPSQHGIAVIAGRNALPAANGPHYRPELQQFQLFDLEPRTLPQRAAPSGPGSPSPETLPSFLNSFPDQLPSLTPTLPDLAALVLQPLLDHTALLADGLLSVFLSPLSHLHLHTHLLVLRSFLLLTSQPFKSRLEAALFSDREDPANGGWNVGRARNTRAARGDTSPAANSQLPWAVGLSSGLIGEGAWPPGGSDLSYYLRTVIVDSLELGYREEPEDHVDDQAHHTIWREAEFRMGFALRELPVVTGREKWLNPSSIEALDFLFMDYQPPAPLGVLIPPEMMSKYQRMFAFTLRLCRVENVSRALFRMARDTRAPLFDTLAKPNKLLLHFRFVAHAFVTALSSYVFDTAVRGNFDAFLHAIAPATATATLSSTFSSASLTSEHHHHRDERARFTDVFALAQHHSDVLDDLLSACLLRSGQKGAGDLLQGCLELVLELGILAGERRRGRVPEYEAAHVLEELFARFQRRMKHLIKALRSMVEKNSTASRFDDVAGAMGYSGRPMDGKDCLRDLILRLDVADWWKRAADAPTRT